MFVCTVEDTITIYLKRVRIEHIMTLEVPFFKKRKKVFDSLEAVGLFLWALPYKLTSC